MGLFGLDADYQASILCGQMMVKVRYPPLSVITTGTTQLSNLFAARLAEIGVRRVYGFPGGGSNLDLIEAADRAGIRWVLAHTEASAGFMACAEAEATGIPGVLLVGNGPGLASCVDAVAHAWLDRVPLLVISDRYTEREASTTGHQILDQRALLAPVVKFSVRWDADTADDALQTAISTALAAPQGPVHLDLPRDQAVSPVHALPIAALHPRNAEPHSADRRFDGAERTFERIATRLHTARRPVVVVGLESNRGIEPEMLTRLAERIGAAVFTTYKAKGTFPEGHERWAGVFTGASIERALIESADVILTVGLDPVELLPRPWRYNVPVLSLRAVYDLNDPSDPSELHVGDVKSAVSTLIGALAPLTPDAPETSSPGFPAEEIADYRDNTLASLRLDPESALPSWRVVERIASLLPAESLVSVDAGAHMFAATTFLRPTSPRCFSISSGLATMGYALPAAIGAALARPESTVVALTGDGGTAYALSELETAVRLGVKVVVVVFNDSSLSLIRVKHEANGFGREPLDYRQVDFAQIARSFGATGATATTDDELYEALEHALARETTTLIDVKVTGREYGRTLSAIRG